MIDTKQFLSAIAQIAEEKGIPQEKIIETIELAIAAAYKKDYGKKSQVIRAKLDAETGQTQIFQVKTVVDDSLIKSEEEVEKEEAMSEEERAEMLAKERELMEADENYIRKIRFNEDRHIMIDDAKKEKKSTKVDDEMEFPMEAHADFGRIAAQTAKQVIIQRLREVEREIAISEYTEKEGEVINAQVQRLEGRNVVLDLGKTLGIMYPEEQIPRESYRIGDRLRVYIVKVEPGARGPLVVVSRSHPKMVAKLFELEIPEIASDIVQIKSIAREAGARTKIAVFTEEEGIDPIGSCVGQRGTRIDTIISELSGEKIDIIEWSEDAVEFISNALSPAKVVDIELNEEERSATVTVPDDQLSLAIGKGGQNVRLAAKLTGWKIDVVSASGEMTKKPEDKEDESGSDSEEAVEDKKEGEEATEKEAEIDTEKTEKAEVEEGVSKEAETETEIAEEEAEVEKEDSKLEDEEKGEEEPKEETSKK